MTISGKGRRCRREFAFRHPFRLGGRWTLAVRGGAGNGRKM